MDIRRSRAFTPPRDDWGADFDAALARVLAFLGLPPDPASSQFSTRIPGFAPVSRSQVLPPIDEIRQAGALEGLNAAPPARGPLAIGAKADQVSAPP